MLVMDWMVRILLAGLASTRINSFSLDNGTIITKLTNCTVNKGYHYELPNGGVPYVLPTSRMMHYFLHDLCGIEIGPSAFAPSGVPTVQVGITEALEADLYHQFHEADIELCGDYAKLDIAAYGDNLYMFANNSVDFVLNSHVWEHFPDPLHVLEEWVRVTRHQGILYIVVPHRHALLEDRTRPLTTISQLVDYHDIRATETHIDYVKYGITAKQHFTIFSPDLLFQIMDWFNNKHCPTCMEDREFLSSNSQSQQRVYLTLLAFSVIDDTAKNGHVMVLQVQKLQEDSSIYDIVDF